MRTVRPIVVPFLAAILLLAGSEARGAGLVSGSYTLSWSGDSTKKETVTETRSLKQTLETKYKGFLSPIVANEITLKIDYDKSNTTPSKLRFYPTVNLTYQGSYWNAGSKRSITREPDTAQKITDTHFVELFYQPARFGMPDLKAKYTADFDVQTGSTDKFKQGVALSSTYKPTDWLDIKGEYSWTQDDERYKKDPTDTTGTPVTREEKYSVTAGVRHFFSEKIRLNSEWKSEFSRNASFFDNGAAKADSAKEEQAHTMKNSLAFKPFTKTTLDLNYDFDLREAMLPTRDTTGKSTQSHTITRNIGATLNQRVAVVDIKGAFTRAENETRHVVLPTVSVDDGWTFEAKSELHRLAILSSTYTRHKIRTDNPGVPNVVPKHTGTDTLSLSWNGKPLPFLSATATLDKTKSFDETIARGYFLKTNETKYGLKAPIEAKTIELTIEPTYDIALKDDYSSPVPALQESISTRDLKIKIMKMLVVTRTIEVKVDHQYARKIESGHRDATLNNITRADTSTGTVTIKDVFPGYTGGIDFSRTANDISGDADGPDVIENMSFKVDYKLEPFSWNATYKYDRNLRSDKFNKWTLDVKAMWVVKNWDLSLTYGQGKTLSPQLDENYKVAIDFKYNF